MSGRTAKRKGRLISLTVKGRVVTDKFICSNIGWLRTKNALKYKGCNYFELYKGIYSYVIRNAY